jgi:hypothetical protein
MNQIIEAHSSNDYKIVHMNKARLVWLSLLPHTSIEMTDAEDDWLNYIATDNDSVSDNDQCIT